MVDFQWMSNGGFLLDGNGDLAVTSAGSNQSLIDLINTRLKAAYNAWQLYTIGADLNSALGQAADPELEIRVQRMVSNSLADILDPGSYEVQTLLDSDSMWVMVYLQSALVAQLQVNLQSNPGIA